MKNIKNFTLTEAGSAEQKLLAASHGVLFLKSESGEDWYECQKTFRNDTIKIMYGPSGIIHSISNKPNADGHFDVSGFFPENMSVAEVEQLPEDADIDGRWCFDGIQVKPREYSVKELQKQAINKKQDLIKQATLQIATLNDAVELGMASAEEQQRLTALKTYRVLLSRVNPGTAPDIDWPQLPQ
ncbi:tail fiber assembly protein [Serratia grimesii]|uniref:Tail fiber assembly protein n=1 Tax=Serratia grimesii TaxID=82995 RepID=A0ABR4U643_9GAMM|nr:tail fiber assembly protein [Serratia grimesii]